MLPNIHFNDFVHLYPHYNYRVPFAWDCQGDFSPRVWQFMEIPQPQPQPGLLNPHITTGAVDTPKQTNPSLPRTRRGPAECGAVARMIFHSAGHKLSPARSLVPVRGAGCVVQQLGCTDPPIPTHPHKPSPAHVGLCFATPLPPAHVPPSVPAGNSFPCKGNSSAGR